MYQIFEIKLKPQEINLESNLDKIKRLNWHQNGNVLVKEDDGLRYILDLSSFTFKCVMGELFLIDEGKWLPNENLSREELVTAALTDLEKLPFKPEISEILRIVKHL